MKWYRGYNKWDMNKVLRISSRDRTIQIISLSLRNLGLRNKWGKKWSSDIKDDEWKGLSDYIVCAESIGSFR